MMIRLALFSLAGLVLFSPSASAQTIIPGTPSKFDKRGTNGGSSVGASIRKQEAAKTRVITYTAVSKQRVWENTDKKGILARLLAFSAPENPKDGPTEIIRDGNVRLLLEKGKKVTVYPLNKLSEPDQLFVKSIAKAARKQPPKKTKPAVELKKSATE